MLIFQWLRWQKVVIDILNHNSGPTTSDSEIDLTGGCKGVDFPTSAIRRERYETFCIVLRSVNFWGRKCVKPRFFIPLTATWFLPSLCDASHAIPASEIYTTEYNVTGFPQHKVVLLSFERHKF